MAPPRTQNRSNPRTAEGRAVIATQDQRAKRSLAALHRGLLALIEEMPFADITIDAIAAKAGVGRATFYRHYATKDDLIDSIATEEIEHLVDLTLPLLNTADTRASCLALCSYVDKHRALWSTLLTGGASAVMRDTFIRLTREKGPTQIPPVETSLPVDLGTICGVAVTFEILAWWLQQDRLVPVEKVAEYLDRMAVSPAFAL